MQTDPTNYVDPTGLLQAAPPEGQAIFYSYVTAISPSMADDSWNRWMSAQMGMIAYGFTYNRTQPSAGGAAASPSVTASDRLNWFRKSFAYLRSFKTDSTTCLSTLEKLGLTVADINSFAQSEKDGGAKMTNAITSRTVLPLDADFRVDASLHQIVYDPNHFSENSAAEMLGTLVHEYGHYKDTDLTDTDLKTRFDIVGPSSRISQRVADDCFKGVGLP